MKRRFFYDAGILLLIFLSFAGFLFHTAAVKESAGEALSLAARVLIPSLFPCMVLSALFIETGAAARLGRRAEGPMRLLFDLPGESVVPLFLGLVAGYPIGARSAVSLYESERLTAGETERLLAFANNAGPAFIYGAVGISLFSSAKAGLLLYISHLLAALAVGVLFRFYHKDAHSREMRAVSPAPAPSFAVCFTSAVKSSALSCTHITAYVVFFSAAIRVLSESGILPRAASGFAAVTGFSPADAQNLLTGMLEMTGGVARVASENSPLPHRLILTAFLLGWAGLSVHAQALSFIGGKSLSLSPYFLGKWLHGTLSALFMLVFTRLFPIAVPAWFSPGFSGVFTFSPGVLLCLSLLSGGILWMFCPVSEKRP